MTDEGGMRDFYYSPEATYDEGFNHGLAAAATWLRAKADKMRKPESDFGAPTANMVARVYEAEADGILSLRE